MMLISQYIFIELHSCSWNTSIEDQWWMKRSLGYTHYFTIVGYNMAITTSQGSLTKHNPSINNCPRRRKKSVHRALVPPNQPLASPPFLKAEKGPFRLIGQRQDCSQFNGIHSPRHSISIKLNSLIWKKSIKPQQIFL